MGWIFKIVLAFIVFSWIFRTVTRFLMGGVIRQAQQQQQRQTQHQQNRPPSGNVNVDFNPGKSASKKKSSDNFKGGDYVDYEELKD